MSKFLGAGSSRRVYLSDDEQRCIKVALEERHEAGVMQNKTEFMHSTLRRRDGKAFVCFPQAFAHSDGFSTIEVEKCSPVTLFQMNEMLEPYISAQNIMTADRMRADQYSGIRLDQNAVRWLAFVFGHFFMSAVESLSLRVKVEKCDVTAKIQSVEEVLSMSLEECAHSKELSMMKGLTPADVPLRFLRDVVEKRHESKILESIYDLLEFYIMYGRDEQFLIADLWDIGQWGLSTSGNVVIIDSGYSKALADSDHYAKRPIRPLQTGVIITPEGQQPNMFNGESLSDIKSPNGANVSTKFYTKSEYILADDGMSRHIKHLGLADDGLWSWSDKMTFMPYDKLKDVMDVIQQHMMIAKKISFDDNSLSVKVPDGSDDGWREVCHIDDVSYAPKIGWHVCEFTFDGFDGKSGIMSRFHPGHDVTFIESNVKGAQVA